MIKILVGLLLSFLFVQCTPNMENSQTNDDTKQHVENTGIQKSETSEITCPDCGHKKMETLPTDVCTIVYTCEKCSARITPKQGDCCVFCTHGTHKCPSMQE